MEPEPDAGSDELLEDDELSSEDELELLTLEEDEED